MCFEKPYLSKLCHEGTFWAKPLRPYAEGLGAEVLITDNNDSYPVATAELSSEH